MNSIHRDEEAEEPINDGTLPLEVLPLMTDESEDSSIGNIPSSVFEFFRMQREKEGRHSSKRASSKKAPMKNEVETSIEYLEVSSDPMPPCKGGVFGGGNLLRVWWREFVVCLVVCLVVCWCISVKLNSKKLADMKASWKNCLNHALEEDQVQERKCGCLDEAAGKNVSGSASVFEIIYSTNHWGGGSETKSGVGSTLENTFWVRLFLHDLVDFAKQHLGKEKITLLDAPSGDCGFMEKFLEERREKAAALGEAMDVEYFGIDIVPYAVKTAITRCGDEDHIKEHDIVAESANQKFNVVLFDIVLSKQMTQHLPSAKASAALENLRKSGSILVATHTPSINGNSDDSLWIGGLENAVELGSLRGGNHPNRRLSYQNLELTPFSLPQPICSVLGDGPESDSNTLGIWLNPSDMCEACDV